MYKSGWGKNKRYLTPAAKCEEGTAVLFLCSFLAGERQAGLFVKTSMRPSECHKAHHVLVILAKFKESFEGTWEKRPTRNIILATFINIHPLKHVGSAAHVRSTIHNFPSVPLGCPDGFFKLGRGEAWHERFHFFELLVLGLKAVLAFFLLIRNFRIFVYINIYSFFAHLERMLCTYIWYATSLAKSDSSTRNSICCLWPVVEVGRSCPRCAQNCTLCTNATTCHECQNGQYLTHTNWCDHASWLKGRSESLSFSHLALRSEWFKFLLASILVAINDLCARPFDELKDLCRTVCWTVRLVWRKECPDGYYKFGEGDVGRICKVCKAPCNTCLGPDLCTEYPGSAGHLNTSSCCF